MGRIVPTSTTFGGSVNIAPTPPVIVTHTAGETLQVGDLVALNGWTNQVQYIMPPESAELGAALRPLNATFASFGETMLPPTTIAAQIANPAPANPAPAKTIVLANKNVLHVWQTTNGQVYFSVTDYKNAIIVQPTIGPAAVAVAVAELFVTALNGSGFAIAYIDSDGTQPTIQIYTDLCERSATTRLPTPSNAMTGGWITAISVLKNGNVVVTSMTGAGVVWFCIMSNLGVTVLAASLISTTTVGTVKPSAQIAALTGGGFGIVATCPDTTAGNTINKYYTFSSAGVQQGPVTVGRVWPGSAPTTSLSALAINNGGWVCFEGMNGPPLFMYAFSSTGVAAPTITVDASNHNPIMGNAIQLTNGAIVLGYTSGPAEVSLKLAQVASNLLGSTLATTAMPVTGGKPEIFESIGYVICYPGTGSVLKNFRYDTGTLLSGWIGDTSISIPSPTQVKLFKTTFPNAPPNAPTFGVALITSSGVTCESRYLARAVMTPIGVVTANASYGQSVPIQTTGTATLLRPWRVPTSIDMRIRAGNTLAIQGATVIMAGIIPKNPITGFGGQLSGVGALPRFTASVLTEVILSCSSGPAGGQVMINNGPIYRASPASQPNDQIYLTLGEGDSMAISTNGEASVYVTIKEM